MAEDQGEDEDDGEKEEGGEEEEGKDEENDQELKEEQPKKDGAKENVEEEEEEDSGDCFDVAPPPGHAPCVDLGGHALKIDHFEQMHELGKDNYLPGAPNFRRVKL